MDYEAARFWVDVAQWIATILIGVYVWQSSKHRVTRERLDQLRDGHDSRLDTHAERLTRLEETMRHLPTSQAITDLTQKIDAVHGDFKALYAEVQGMKELGKVMRRQVELMDTFLRQQNRPTL